MRSNRRGLAKPLPHGAFQRLLRHLPSACAMQAGQRLEEAGRTSPEIASRPSLFGSEIEKTSMRAQPIASAVGEQLLTKIE